MISARAALAAILTVLGAGCLLAGRSELLHSFELKTLDWRFRNFSPRAQEDRGIVLLMLDQQSLDHFERDGVYWPWPRSIYEAVLDYCKAGGARAVVFDALFTSPSPYGRSEDEAFAAALKRSGVGVLAMEMAAREGQAPPARFALKVAGDLSRAAVARRSARVPVKQLLEASAALGDTSARPDQDGVFRRLPLLSTLGDAHYPTLAASAVLAVSRKKEVEAVPGGLRLGDYEAPLTDGALLVRFRNPSGIPAYPLGRVIQSWQNISERQPPDLPLESVKDKLVFVGYSAPGLMDLRPTPVSAVSPGTAIVAEAAANILGGDFLRPIAPLWGSLLALLCLLAAAAAPLLLSDVRLAAAGAALLSGTAAGGALAAFYAGVWVDMVVPQLALWLGFLTTSAYGYAVEGRKKREIQRAFAHYLAPEVVAQIADDPAKLALGGERRELSCYFSDIEGFTTISESLTPDRLTYLMNRYLTEMTETILESQGTLDKYIGDAIMAFWGAPMAMSGHAAAACRVAVENQRKLKALSRALEAEGFPPIRTRIGLNSGAASVGNMGSKRRFSYTALGDDINLASRLEGANKHYGTYIMVAEATRVQAGSAIEVRELDLLKVKGKAKAVRVYELLGMAGDVEAVVLEKARRFEAALALYRGRGFREALAAFAKLQPDKAAGMYAERCRGFLESPPPHDWDGSYALTEK